MDWGVKENHVAVIGLRNCGKYFSQIFKLLKQLEISWMFIYLAIKRNKELWRVEDRTYGKTMHSWLKWHMVSGFDIGCARTSFSSLSIFMSVMQLELGM